LGNDDFVFLMKQTLQDAAVESVILGDQHLHVAPREAGAGRDGHDPVRPAGAEGKERRPAGRPHAPFVVIAATPLWPSPAQNKKAPPAACGWPRAWLGDRTAAGQPAGAARCW